ncbi:hypothetical protein LB554_15180 [Mesorhizobium sp. CO1-1-11]|uniref:hypothetical protein n=1 Tax=Mesorhizobium sp. CO1-1-11 TaxID=2876636 RepID=UPI001CCAE4CA|nr:hypothetical protein [Mesorhizobium sp. CO1-1-11]MBZ9725293.1 hypothetical protein [Mesorhizobium sp. CO1-1-11]
MKINPIMALGAIAVLCGCQTGNQADYMQIGYGPSFDVAHAQCELKKGSADQGYLRSDRRALWRVPELATLSATWPPKINS